MASRNRRHRPSFTKAYSFGIVTAALFVLAWTGQFVFQLLTVQQEAAEHGQAFAWAQFFPQFLASTMENWQSEFLQLLWQAAGLTFLFFWGSSQSKESDERLEAKVDALLRERGLDPDRLSRESDQSM